jgi:hypothetical protein
MNTLWALLPWSVIFFVALGRKIIDFIRIGFSIKEDSFDAIPLFGFLLPFIALSTSKYQLPHYAFVTYPFAAIMLAEYIFYHWQRPKDSLSISFLKNIQWIIILLLWICGFGLSYFIFPEGNTIPLILYGLLFIVLIYFTSSEYRQFRTIFASIFTAFSLNLLLSIQVYPNLLKYQYTNTIGKYIAEKEFDTSQVFTYNTNSYQSLEAYAHINPPAIDDKDNRFLDKNTFNENHPLILITNDEGYYQLKQKNYTKVLRLGKHYKVQALNASFIIPMSRNQVCENLYLVAVWR